MNDMTPSPPANGKGQQLLAELDERTNQFAGTLPAHIPVERFKRVILTAINQNPDLARADRRSFWNSAMRAANDGLLPDGRDGALVIYNTKVKNKETGKESWVQAVQWMVMIGGLRKKVRNSGEIKDWNAHVVYAKDAFEFELGDNPFIRHKPHMGGDPGPMVAAYSVAHFKTGEISREVMMAHEVAKVRASSKSKDSGPWAAWPGEMWRKTVARRHSKVLPMSTDLDDLMRRDDALYNLDGASDRAVSAEAEPHKINRLGDRLDALAGSDEAGAEIDGEVTDPDTGEVQDQTKSTSDERSPPASSESRETASGQSTGKGADNSTSPEKSAPKGKDEAKDEKSADKAGQAAKSDEQAAKAEKAKLYLDDLKQTGERAAAEGVDALQEFLDGLEGDDSALVNAFVTGWLKTANAAGKAVKS